MTKARDTRVAVIGAGFAGISAAYYLQRAGFDSFTVFDQAGGPGGVWWNNRYPGAAVDTPTHMYSFSFRRNDWTKSHADQAELQSYMAATIEEFGLGDHFRYETRVKALHWVESAQHWRVETERGAEEFDFVISAVGLLNVPKYPQWRGLDDFAGCKLHTIEWDHNVDVSNRVVAVVGTGSTAVQIVPRIADTARHTYVFQREPGWINPKPVHVYSDAERRRLGSRLHYMWMRVKGYIDAAKSREGGDIHKAGSLANQKAMARCREYIDTVFKDRPDLRAAVTPDYPYFGKRPIKDSEFYPALLRDDVELVPCGIERVTPDGVVDSRGVERQVDVLVIATGYHANEYLRDLEVRGRGGTELHEFWGGEPRAFLGLMVPSFPNFFMLYGPNTNSPVTLFMLENQARFAVRAIRTTLRKRRRMVDVRESAFERYDRWMLEQMRDSVWSTSNNYFKTASGRVVTQWPTNPIVYWAMSRVLPRSALRFGAGPPAEIRHDPCP